MQIETVMCLILTENLTKSKQVDIVDFTGMGNT